MREFTVYSKGGYAWRDKIYVNLQCILTVAMRGEAKYMQIYCVF